MCVCCSRSDVGELDAICRRLIEEVEKLEVNPCDTKKGQKANTKVRRIHNSKTAIKCGNWVDMKDHNGNSAIHYAARSSNVKALKLLLDRGASITLKNNRNQTPLQVALDNKDSNQHAAQCVQILQQRWKILEQAAASAEQKILRNDLGREKKVKGTPQIHTKDKNNNRRKKRERNEKTHPTNKDVHIKEEEAEERDEPTDKGENVDEHDQTEDIEEKLLDHDDNDDDLARKAQGHSSRDSSNAESKACKIEEDLRTASRENGMEEDSEWRTSKRAPRRRTNELIDHATQHGANGQKELNNRNWANVVKSSHGKHVPQRRVSPFYPINNTKSWALNNLLSWFRFCPNWLGLAT